MREGKTCEDCRLCITVDSGYSNYTVEGRTVYCSENQQESFDAWYGKDEKLKKAETCVYFEGGGGAHIDVDREAVPYDHEGDIGSFYSDNQDIIDYIDNVIGG